jgi:hypothetical protein
MMPRSEVWHFLIMAPPRLLAAGGLSPPSQSAVIVGHPISDRPSRLEDTGSPGFLLKKPHTSLY